MDIQELKSKKVELEQKLAEINATIKSYREPVAIYNFFLNRDQLRFNVSSTREDIVEILRDCDAKLNYGNYIVDASLADGLLIKLEKLEGVTIKIDDKLRESLVNYVPTPHLSFTLDNSKTLIKIEKSFKVDYGLMPALLGTSYNHVYRCDVLPVNSIIGLDEFLTKYHAKHPDATIVIQDEVKELLERELKRRKKYLEILEKEPEEVYLNDIKLRPFQVKGRNLAKLSKGNFIIAFEMGLGKTPTALAYTLISED